MVRLSYAIFFAAVALVLINGQANLTSSFSQNSLQQNAPNLTISNIYIPSNLSLYSPLPLSFNVTNTGGYASGNVTLKIDDYGTNSYSTSLNLPGLSPGQSDQVFFYLNKGTSMAGGYAVYIYSSYVSNNQIYNSGSAITGYTVTNPGFAGAQPLFNQTVQNLEIKSIPFVYFINSQQGNQVSELQLLYGGENPATIDIGIPGIFSNLVSISSKSLYMQKNESLGSSMLIKVGNQNYETTYIIPINLTIVNGTKNPANYRYMQLSVVNYPTSNAFLSQQSSLLNNSKAISGTLQIKSPSSSGLPNTRVEMIFPVNVSRSAQSIDAYGTAANVFEQSGNYTLTWNVGDIGSNQNVYLYYDIGEIRNPSSFRNSQRIMYSVGEVTQKNIFKLMGTSLPVLYVNSTAQLNISLLYTGTAKTLAMISMPSTLGGSASAPTRTVNMSPNQLVNLSFNVSSTNYTGTIPMKLYILAQGVNSTYSVPIIVVATPKTAAGVIFGFLSTFKYFVLTIVLAVAAVLAYRYRRDKSPIEYSEDRAKGLIQIREQMRRRR